MENKIIGGYSVEALYCLLRYGRKNDGYWEDLEGDLPDEDQAQRIVELLAADDAST